MCIRDSMHTRTRTHTHTRRPTHTRTHTHTHAYTHAHTHTHTTHTHTHTHMHTHTHTHTHTQTTATARLGLWHFTSTITTSSALPLPYPAMTNVSGISLNDIKRLCISTLSIFDIHRTYFVLQKKDETFKHHLTSVQMCSTLFWNLFINAKEWSDTVQCMCAVFFAGLARYNSQHSRQWPLDIIVSWVHRLTLDMPTAHWTSSSLESTDWLLTAGTSVGSRQCICNRKH